MGRSKSSHRWLQEHNSDHYVKRAQQEGYRSRASYKLIELDQKDRFIRPGMRVIDLGSAPGGWTQVAANLVGHKGKVVASDILAMDTIAGVDFVQGDFTEERVLKEILDTLNNELVDLVLSDMAPNISGMRAVDQPKSMYLVELALDLVGKILKPDGSFVAKVFHGEGFDQYILEVKRCFDRVVARKPNASRARSREVYIVATGYKP